MSIGNHLTLPIEPSAMQASASVSHIFRGTSTELPQRLPPRNNFQFWHEITPGREKKASEFGGHGIWEATRLLLATMGSHEAFGMKQERKAT